MSRSLLNAVEVWLEGHKLNIPDVTNPDVWDRFLQVVWDRLSKLAKTMYQHSRPVIEKGLVLYYTANDPAVPRDVKLKIAAALAYLLSPIDLIPDAIPIIGHLDDLLVLSITMLAVKDNVTAEAKKQSEEAVENLFGRGTSLAD